MTEEPVDIELRLIQDVETEGMKAGKAIDDVAAKSEKAQEKITNAAKKAALDAEREAKKAATEAEKAEKRKIIASEKAAERAAIASEKEAQKLIIAAEKAAERAAIAAEKAAQRKIIAEEKAAEFIAKSNAKTNNILDKQQADLTQRMTKRANGLQMSVSQVMREVPNFAISPQIGIMSLGNNLPILQEDVKRLIQLNRELKAAGQETIPVWRQVWKAVGSWQTVLIVGISLLTAYGKEIFAATKQLLTFSDATKLSRDEIKKFTTELSKGMGSELGKMDMMFDKLEKAKKGTSEYYSAKRDIIKQYGSYLSGLDSEITKLNNVEAAYNAIRSAIMETAKEKVLSQVYVEQGQKAEDAFIKNLPDIEKALKKSDWGEQVGGFYFEQIKNKLRTGKGLDYELQRIVDGFKTIETRITPGTFGQSFYEVEVNKVQESIDKIIDAQNIYIKKRKDAEKTFGSLYSSNTSQNKSLIQEQELLLEQAKLMPEATEVEIKAKNQKIEAIETEIKRLNELGKTNKNELKSEQDYANKRQELIRAEVELQFAASQAKIDAMKEGADKELEQMKLNHKKELAELDKQREDFAKRQFEADEKNKGKIFDAKKPGLSPSQEMVFSGIKSDILKNQQREIAEFYKKALSDYYTYAEAVKALNEKFNSDKSALVGLGASKENLAELERQRDEALEKLSLTFAEKSDSYENWLVGLAAMSLETLRRELANAQNVLLATTEGKNDQNNTEKVAQLRAKIAVLEKTIRDLSAKKAKKDSKDTKKSIEEWKDLRSALSDVKNEFQEIGDALGGVGGAILSESGQIAASTLQMIDGITTLANWSVTATQMAAEGASEAIIAVERASIILAVISTAMQIATKIITLLKGKSEAQKDTEELKRTSEKISDIYQAINKQLEKRIELIKEAAGAEADYLNTISQDEIAKQKKYIEQQLKNLRDNELFGKAGKNNDLDLNDVMRLFGLKSITDFIKWWNEGGYLQLIAGGYSVTNKDSWQTIIDSWNDLADASEESTKAMKEAITGISFDSLKDSLDDLIKDVKTSASDIADSFSGTIEDSLLSWVKSSYLNDAMQDWYDDLTGAFSDDMISSDEYAQLQALYESIYNQAQDMYNTAAEAAGIDLKSKDRQASKKSIATASQDSVDENNGRLTAIQGFTAETRNSAAEIVTLMKDAKAFRTVLENQINRIAENSEYLKYLKEVKEGIDDMNLKGVKIKTA